MNDIISYVGNPSANIKTKDVKDFINFMISRMTIAPPAYDSLPDNLKQYFLEFKRKEDSGISLSKPE